MTALINAGLERARREPPCCRPPWGPISTIIEGRRDKQPNLHQIHLSDLPPLLLFEPSTPVYGVGLPRFRRHRLCRQRFLLPMALERNRTEVAQRRMTPLAVVEDPQVLEDRSTRLRSRRRERNAASRDASASG